jgi:hypothetical protein
MANIVFFLSVSVIAGGADKADKIDNIIHAYLDKRKYKMIVYLNDVTWYVFNDLSIFAVV